MDKGVRSIFYDLGIWFLAGYIFFGTFITGVTGLPVIKALFSVGALLFMGGYFLIGYSECKHRNYFWLAIVITLVYVVVFHKMTLLSHFYVAIFGMFYAANKQKAYKVIRFVFIAQFVLITYEFFTQSLIYTQVTAGLLSKVEVEQTTELFEYSGFRTKGLFMGTLEAASFCIGCSLLFSKNLSSSIWCMVMALMINGRMAMLVCFTILVYNIYLYARRKHVSDFTIKLSFVFVGLLFFAFITYKATTSVRLEHLLDVTNFESADNAGRLLSYTQGWAVFTQNYSLFDKLSGGEYELLDVYGRATLSAESEITGTLLDVGIIGLIWILSPVLTCLFRRKTKWFSKDYISGRFLALLSLVCLIQYRHVSGNVRGVLFWLLMFLIMEGYFDQVQKKHSTSTNENQNS